MFEVWEEEVQFESLSADKAARVFGVGEIKTIRSRVRWSGCLIGPGATGVRARATEMPEAPWECSEG